MLFHLLLLVYDVYGNTTAATITSALLISIKLRPIVLLPHQREQQQNIDNYNCHYHCYLKVQFPV